MVDKHVWGACGVRRVGSSPISRTKKEVTFVYQKLLLFLSKPQAWHIITRQRVYHRRRRISSAEGCITCGLMRCNTACWWYAIPAELMLYKASPWQTESHFCLPTKVTFFNDIRSLWNGWYIFDMISHCRAMIYACGIWGTDIISWLRSKYIIRLAVYHIASAIYHWKRKGTSFQIPLNFLDRCVTIILPHKFIFSKSEACVFTLVKMQALLSYAFGVGIICVATNGAMRFSVRSFGYALF